MVFPGTDIADNAARRIDLEQFAPGDGVAHRIALRVFGLHRADNDRVGSAGPVLLQLERPHIRKLRSLIRLQLLVAKVDRRGDGGRDSLTADARIRRGVVHGEQPEGIFTHVQAIKRVAGLVGVGDVDLILHFFTVFLVAQRQLFRSATAEHPVQGDGVAVRIIGGEAGDRRGRNDGERGATTDDRIITRGGVHGDQPEGVVAQPQFRERVAGLGGFIKGDLLLIGAIAVVQRQLCRSAAAEHPAQLDFLIAGLFGFGVGDRRGQKVHDVDHGGVTDARIGRGGVLDV